MNRKGILLLASCLVLLASACTPLKFFLHSLDPDEDPAVYTLQPRSTLVLVDDPNFALPEDSFKASLAQAIQSNLEKNIKKITFISQQQLVNLQTSTGPDFAKMAVNRVGILLKADQVVYVTVESVNLHNQPGLVTPDALVRVKVIESNTGKRLFPLTRNDLPGDVTDSAERGQPVSVTLGFETIDTEQRTAIDAVYRKLIGQLGTDVAELFYKHPRQNKPVTDTN